MSSAPRTLSSPQRAQPRARRSALGRQVALLSAATAGLGCALGGCGGSSGSDLASKSAPQILAASRTAAESASSVHLELKLAQRSVHSTIVGDFVRGRGARVRLSLLDVKYEAVVIGDTAYVKASPVVLSELGIKSTRARNAWLKGPARSGPLAGIAENFLGNAFLRNLLGGSGRLAKVGAATVLGQKAFKLKETGRGLYTGFVYVAASGKPYPIELEKQGTEHGTVTLSRWNQPVTLTAPAGALDIATLTHQSS
jgi:hypothetical protein